MRQIDRHNYKDFDPGTLADLFANNQAVIIETAADVVGEIVSAISKAIMERNRFRNNVKNYIATHQQLDDAMLADLKALKNEVKELRVLVEQLKPKS
jgi:hypothetical protein